LKRLASIIVLFGVLGIGTGGLDFLHELTHQAEDARLDAFLKAAGLPVGTHHHDESNCQVCAQLHMMVLWMGWMPVLICLGLFVAFLTLLDQPLIGRLQPARIDCRGPPVRFTPR
jgi:hypothetical protein